MRLEEDSGVIESVVPVVLNRGRCAGSNTKPSKMGMQQTGLVGSDVEVLAHLEEWLALPFHVHPVERLWVPETNLRE